MTFTLDDFLRKLRSGCDRVRLQRGRWLVAVSGGADSVALLRGLLRLNNERHGDIVVAHFDHRLRGEESTADAEWVHQLAARFDLPFCLGFADRTALEPGDAEATFDEDTARRQRYAFLLRTAINERCSVIATAHTADDQAETVLHHLLRGTGLAGLGGIPWERELTPVDASSVKCRVVRPMLALTREQVLAFLQQSGQDFREDRTNVDLRLTRNWLRHTVLPLLRQRWPQVTQSLCRLSQQADAAASVLSQLAAELLQSALMDLQDNVVRLSAPALCDRPRHLVRQVFVELWERQRWPLQSMGYDHWDQLAGLVEHEGVCQLPGAVEARRRGQLLVLTRQSNG